MCPPPVLEESPDERDCDCDPTCWLSIAILPVKPTPPWQQSANKTPAGESEHHRLCETCGTEAAHEPRGARKRTERQHCAEPARDRSDTLFLHVSDGLQTAPLRRELLALLIELALD